MNTKLGKTAWGIVVAGHNLYERGARLFALRPPARRRFTPPAPRQCTRADLKKALEARIDFVPDGHTVIRREWDVVGVAIGIDVGEKEALAQEDLGRWYMTFYEEHLRHLVNDGTPYFCDNCRARFREREEAVSHLG